MKLGNELEIKTDKDYDFFIGKKVLVRHNMFGVNYGTIKVIDDKKIILEKSRKLWSWSIEDVGATVEDIAVKGLNSDKKKSKVSDFVDVLLIPNNEHLCAVILCSDSGILSIESAPIAHQN